MSSMVNRSFDFLLRLRKRRNGERRNGRKVRKPAMATAKPPLLFLITRPLTFVFVRQILFSSFQARFCLNLRGRRRWGSPATTSVDPTKSSNLAVACSLTSDSPTTISMKSLSKIRPLISDSLATGSRNPTLFSNLVARLIGTPASSSCIQILGVPSPAFTKNIFSPKRKTSDFKAFPLPKKKLELDLGNDRLK